MTPPLRALPAIAMLLIATPAIAQTARPLADADRTVALEDGSQLWFVELTGAPAIEAGDPAAIAAGHDAFRRNAAAAGVRFRERQSFRRLWNGLAIAVDSGQLGKLRLLPGVLALYPVVQVALPDEPGITTPQMMSALTMTRADYVQQVLGHDGAGVRVGIIDTGVDYDHPDLGGDGVARSGSTEFPNARVVAGWDFCGDDFDGGRPEPDPYPDDCNGHGTHVAGVVGARGGVTGVAPGALIGAYRIFGCHGETTTDLIVAALERAFEDGMDVVNLSIGAPFEWPDYPTARAADRLVDHGVVVVGAQGNNGSSGLYAANAPGTGRKVISVASFQNVLFNLPAFRVTPDDHTTTYTAVRGAPAPPLAGSFPLARTGDKTTPADACTELPAGSLAGRVALIRAGSCEARVKCLNAQAAGAAAVVLYSDAFGSFRPEVAGDPAVAIPVVATSRAEGELLDDRLVQGVVTITWSVSSTPGFNGGSISPFSSFGPAPDLSLKPNLGAPGGGVLSTWLLESGGYLNNSGTSMSTPHVAGAVALLLEARPGTPAERVRTRLENTAAPRPWEGDPARLDAVHRQGAGLLDIAAAIEASAWIEPGELELGESEGGVATRRLAVHNDAPRAVTFALGHEPALATGPDPFILSYPGGPAAVTFRDSTVTVRAGGSAHIQVAIAPDPALPDRSLYGGYLTLRPEGGGDVLRVPYLGFKGDYQSLPVLTSAGAGFPWLARVVNGFIVNQPDGATFSLLGEDLPWIAYHLDHQASRLVMEVFDAASGKSWHRMEAFENVPRSTTGGSFFADPWDGHTRAGNGRVFEVPDGRYVIEVSALRALGDPSMPEHWDRWTSPVLTIARSASTAALAAEQVSAGAPLAGEGTLALAPVRPNPAGGPMTFAFSLARPGPAALEVFDIGGRRLAIWRWGSVAAGEHAVVWDGRTEAGARAAAGAVLVRLSAEGRSLTRKAAVVR